MHTIPALHAVRDGQTRKREHGRHKIGHIEGPRNARAFAPQQTRIADQQRDAHGLVPRMQLGCETLRQHHIAVIGHEHDDRIVRNPRFFERTKEALEARIERRHMGVITAQNPGGFGPLRRRP